jgi:TolA-binding protein
VTYPQPFVGEIIERDGVPIQIDNSQNANKALLDGMHHIWTPDIRILDSGGAELYRWDGYLPPNEYAARALVGFAQAYLRTRNYARAEQLYADALTRFPTSLAAAEAQYYLGVTRYRADPESNELLHQWAMLRSKYPESEYRVKQSFKEIPE